MLSYKTGSLGHPNNKKEGTLKPFLTEDIHVVRHEIVSDAGPLAGTVHRFVPVDFIRSTWIHGGGHFVLQERKI